MEQLVSKVILSYDKKLKVVYNECDMLVDEKLKNWIAIDTGIQK